MFKYPSIDAIGDPLNQWNSPFEVNIDEIISYILQKL